MPDRTKHPSRVLFPEVFFTAALYALLLVLFAALRLLLLWRNESLAAGIPAATLLQSFLVGLRFDLAISSYLLIPLFLLLLFLRGRRRMQAVGGFSLLVGGLVLLGISEVEFYRELEMRFNTLVFEYLGHPKIVGGMIWEGYPVLRYLLLWGALTVLFAGAALWLARRLLSSPPPTGTAAILSRAMAATVMLALMIFASRGGFGHEPLRWGDAFFCEDAFANNLALNGVFTLGRSAIEKYAGSQAAWSRALPRAEALRTTQAMLRLPGEVDLASANYPLLRREAPVPVISGDPQRPVNVVVILMESFSGRHVGALGAPPPSLTPAFDALCRDGVLFTRAFSNGTHTHQGVFASLAGFPNLPGYEYLMKTMEANQGFSGLPNLLHPLGYETVFLYNGLFSWDNKEGFFRQHGIDRFIGTGDYVAPTFVDPVWGVSDYDVFMRANEEFRTMARKGPFFAAILTLSNHSPFNLPEPLPFERIRSGDAMEGRYNTMRYADWALGEFFRKASREEYFTNTLFVLTGDHGFGTPPAITGMQLEKFHVPLLFYAPQLLLEKGVRSETVASQVDIGPSVLGLLGLDRPHQGWGRNLFESALADPGFAVVKPSGGAEEVALIEGDYLVMRTAREKPRLYRFTLDFPPASAQLDDAGRLQAMDRRLQAYVETGLLALRERKVGLPDESHAATVH